MLEINASAIVAEIGSLHDAYERALAANDIPALNAFFWDSDLIVRYGVTEQLYGAGAVAAYRQNHTPVFSDRQLVRRSILALGTDAASVMCELEQKVFGQQRHSRQSQVWARIPDAGWKIVAAHVSHAPAPVDPVVSWDSYVDRASAAIGLPIDPAHRPGVARTLQRTAGVVEALLAVPLPPGLEAAPVFTA